MCTFSHSMVWLCLYRKIGFTKVRFGIMKMVKGIEGLAYWDCFVNLTMVSFNLFCCSNKGLAIVRSPLNGR